MPFLHRINAGGFSRNDQQAMLAEFQAIRAELDDMRAKFAALQTALNAGTAVGAAGYPNASMALAAPKFTAT